MEDMNALSETDFSVLSHPIFPNYNVRIKKSPFCDDTVKFVPGIYGHGTPDQTVYVKGLHWLH